MQPADKFQYLIQSTHPSSAARELVESYPATGENYELVMKQRFGREEILIEVYVLELLQIVLINASNSKSKLTLSSLYNKLSSHLRALSSLGVTTEKCAAMLYPLVESCLPEEVLMA